MLPAARDVILPHHLPIHNIQCWKNSAVGLTGLLLGDSDLIQAAIDDPDRGYRVQMSKGVQSDGVWYEGAWGYHFYTLSAVWPLAEAARNCGMNLYGDPLRKMFEAPIQLAMPNLKLPAFNDSTEVDVHNPLYELAYARYHDPIDLAGLAGLNLSQRVTMLLWFGVDALPADTPVCPRQPQRNHLRLRHPAARPRRAGRRPICLEYGARTATVCKAIPMSTISCSIHAARCCSPIRAHVLTARRCMANGIA